MVYSDYYVFMKGRRAMKQLLLILLVLAFSVPASATVLVYNIKETCTGMDYYMDYGEYKWHQYKESWTGYLLIEQIDANTAEVQAVWTWKEGKQKYAEVENWGKVAFIAADLGNGKELQIISASNDEERSLFTGASKIKKISAYKAASCDLCHGSDIVPPGDIAQKLPSSLAGYLVTDYKEGDPLTYRDIYTSKMSLNLNAKYTLEGHLHNAMNINDAVDSLLEFLENEQGYYVYWP
jgi:hypothetical protein